jgi:hypothetical protein
MELKIKVMIHQQPSYLHYFEVSHHQALYPRSLIRFIHSPPTQLASAYAISAIVRQLASLENPHVTPLYHRTEKSGAGKARHLTKLLELEATARKWEDDESWENGHCRKFWLGLTMK